MVHRPTPSILPEPGARRGAERHISHSHVVVPAVCLFYRQTSERPPLGAEGMHLHLASRHVWVPGVGGPGGGPGTPTRPAT